MKQPHVAVYDYGMGGIWLLIDAESAQAIEQRWPALKVVRIGDPDWVTPEKYAEITETDRWIPSSMRFDFDHPTGWLAESEDELTSPK